MDRKKFIQSTALGTAGLTLAKCNTIFPADSTITYRKLPRWRGFNLQEKFYHDRNQPFKEKDFELMKEWGFDFVRLAMSYRCWTPDATKWDKLDDKTLKEIDDAVELGKQYGIHVQINFHRIPGFCVNDHVTEPFDLFKDEEALKAAKYHWAMFTERYKGIPNKHVSFNLFNEPIRPPRDKHIHVVNELVRTIREKDTERLIIADGEVWGRKPVAEFCKLKIAQSFHFYDPIHVCFYKMGLPGSEKWPLPTWPVTVDQPLEDYQSGYWDRDRLKKEFVDKWKIIEDQGCGIHIGETGCFSKTPHQVTLNWLSDIISLCTDTGWGWALWSFRGQLGILDSKRKDVKYEKYKGHLLDRKMLELLKNDGHYV
jgi:endoglucanase